MSMNAANAFRMVLSRSGFTDKPQILARRLLQLKADENGRIPLTKAAIGSSLLDHYPPKVLREMLCDAGLVAPDFNPNSRDGWYVLPIGKFAEYRLSSTQKLKSEIEQIKTVQEQHARELAAIWDAIRHLEHDDPPVTIEKIERHLKLANG